MAAGTMAAPARRRPLALVLLALATGCGAPDGGVRPPGRAVAVAAGYRQSCALLEDGTVRCWGLKLFGQSGDGTPKTSGTAVAVPELTGAVGLSFGWDHACAVLADRTVRCWGGNGCGELGDGTTKSANAPVAVAGLANAVAVAAGDYHTCALLGDGTVRCWGCNWDGGLGDGTTENSSTPVPVAALAGAVGLAVRTSGSSGSVLSCAVLADGTVRCWGENTWGQLGDGTLQDSVVPLAVQGL
ncbi:MAG: hypothetical protein HY744_10070 [Deltaproteobacteria bacterium]|nr:hypothetical protein [Deltaproteobacteria bacterium]